MGSSEIKIYNFMGEMVMTKNIHTMYSQHRLNIEQLARWSIFCENLR